MPEPEAGPLEFQSDPLLSSEEILRLIEQNVTDYAIIALDVDGRVASWNKGAEGILGYRESEIVGQPISVIFTQEDLNAGSLDREMTDAREQGRVLNESWRVRKDGSRIWGSGIMTALRDESGNLRGYAKILRDATERREADQRIQDLNEELQSLNARLQRAMTETHHRVKNNLQLISALIGMHQQAGSESIPMAELARLGSNVQALAIIHDILTHEAKQGNDQETLSAKAVLERLAGTIAQTIGNRRLKASFEDIRLVGRQTTTLALIANELIANALKHGQGEIEIALKIEGAEATLDVCDDGPGFSEGYSTPPLRRAPDLN